MAIFCFKEKDDTINALVSGKVSREPEIKSSTAGDRVRFSVAYGKKKFMEIEAWCNGIVGDMAGALEKGDVVLVSGTYRSWEYNAKTYSAITADAILPLTFPQDVTGVPSAPAKKTTEQYKSGKFEDIEYGEADGEDDLPF